MFLTAAALCCSGAALAVPLDHVVFDQCMAAPARTQQVDTMDRRNVQDLMRRFGQAPVPANYHAMLARLVKADPQLTGQKIRLVAYKAKFLNAHEADHGVIVISAGAWGKASPLADDEIAAMLAHELAHLERKDSKRMACESLAYVGNTALTLPSAIRETTRESFSGESDLSLTLTALNQAREKAADARGAQILRMAGYDPRAMTRMLRKLAPPGVFSSSTHPATDARIRHVLESIDRGRDGH